MSLRGTLWVEDKKAWLACLPARRANVSKEKIIDPFSPKSGVLKKVRIRPGEIRVQSVYEIKIKAENLILGNFALQRHV